MFSRFTSLLILGMTFSSGCSWVKDKPKASAQIKSESLDLSCLQTAPVQLQKLFEGAYTRSAEDQAQVQAIWTCLDRSLHTFAKNTRGAKPGVYTSRELQTFANRYLPATKPLSLEFTNAIFRLKKAVLGGSDVELTLEEINGNPSTEYKGLRDKLNAFGEMILPLSPHMALLLTPNQNLEMGRKPLAAEALRKFVMNLASLLSDSKNELPWSDLGDFVRELEKFTRVDKPTALTVVHEQLGVYQYFKLLLVGGNEFTIEKTKWRPIFAAISHFWNALFLSSNTVETLEELSIEVQSTEAEQKQAVDKLNTLFKNLRVDSKVSSKKMLGQLSDRWGKALVLNAILFPRNQGSLALKTFLGSAGLRKLAGYLLDQIKALQSNSDDPVKIQALADNLINFIVQASNENSVGGVLTPIAFGPLKAYVQQLKPLFSDDKEFQATMLAIDLFKNAAPILCGKESDSYLPKDLKAVIQKSVDLFFTWRKESKLAIPEAIGRSFDIIVRSPSVEVAKLDQLLGAIQITEHLLRLMDIKTTMNWRTISDYVKNGFSLKALIFGNSDKVISGFEVKTMADLWVPFRSSKPLADNLAAVATLLQKNSFAPVSIEKLIPAVNRFLPADQQIESFGVNAKLLGLLKAAFIGGTDSRIENQDYPKIAKLAANLMARLEPIQKSLPKDFKVGLNAKSIELMAGGLDGFADSIDKVPYTRIRPLAAELLKMNGYKVRETTLEKLLVGLSHRMLGRQTTPKPKRATGELTKSHLKLLGTLLRPIQKDWEDIEQAYAGLNTDLTPMKRAQLNSKLKTPEMKEVVKIIPPLLDGNEKIVHIYGHGTADDYYAFDLTYKSLMRRLVTWLFPAYQLEADKGKATGRLTYNDVVDLLGDINELMLDLKVVYGINPETVTATKRMQTINLFTKNGNGDEYMDINETTEFLTISMGGKVLLEQVLEKLTKDCHLDQTKEVIPYACLKEKFSIPRYFSDAYGKAVPEMSKQYSTYSDEDRKAFMVSMFNATDVRWEEKKEMTLSDFETFMAIPYYTESIFERMDTDHNQIVNFSEGMAGFPLFCKEIKKVGGSSIKGSCENGYPNQIEAVYGHLLFRGEPPRGPKPGDNLLRKAVEIKRILGWFRYWKRLPRDPEYRNTQPPLLNRKDILQIISNLAMATDVPLSDIPDESESDEPSGLKPRVDALLESQ